MALDPSISLIRGLQVSVALNGATVTVSPGICYTPGTGRIVNPANNSIVLSGASANTYYHLYAYQGPDGTMALELSTTGPDTPYLGTARCKTCDTTRRYLATGRTNASSVFRPAKHTRPADMGNRVMLDMATAAGSLPLNLLSGLTTQAVQSIDLSSVIPVTATRAIVQVLNPSTWTLYIGRSETGTVSSSIYQYAAVPGSCPVLDVTLDAGRKFTCVLSQTTILGGIIALLTGSASINLIGYDFDR